MCAKLAAALVSQMNKYNIDSRESMRKINETKRGLAIQRKATERKKESGDGEKAERHSKSKRNRAQ